MSGSLWPLELKHARLPCPSPSPRACSNSCPLSQWCHPTISSCCPLLLLPSVFPSIRVFSNESGLRIRWPKYWSFSFSIILQMNFQGWFPLGLTGLISLLSKGFSRVFSSTTIWKHQFFSTQLSLWSNSHIHTWLTFPLAIYLTHSAWRIPGTLKSLLQHHSSKASILLHSAFFIVQFSHPYITTGEIIALTRQTFVDKVMSLFSNMLSMLVITFLPRSKHLLISWLQSPSVVILEPKI